MKTTERFDRAVTKLYNAFHENRLNPLNCQACAVGNIVGHGNWNFRVPALDGLKLWNPHMKNNDSGYSEEQLQEVELRFLTAWPLLEIKQIDKLNNSKERQFKGLCAVVEYLCELDGIPNVMDFTKLFEYDKENQPIHQL